MQGNDTFPDAPFFRDIADGPGTGRAIWVHAEDGVRLRLGYWPLEGAKGTVLIMPGRTEYVEKYGRVARELATRGYAAVALDWRGQGLADRLGRVPSVGHVGRFQDFQKDWAAFMGALDALACPELPKPKAFVAHSMGGGIAMRTLLDGAAQAAGFRAVAFTGPMWDIELTKPMRLFARIVAGCGSAIGLGKLFVPGGSGKTYVKEADFEDNTLTRDEDMWNYMRGQLVTEPELALSGPSLRWLSDALAEGRTFAASPPPELPGLVFLGTHERIVSSDAIHAMTQRWSSCELRMIEDGEHEIMMHGPEVRRAVFDDMIAFFEKNGAV